MTLEENKVEDKPKVRKKGLIILAIVALIIICAICYEMHNLHIIQNGNWETKDGYAIKLAKDGSFAFYSIGAGAPVGYFDLYPHYKYFGSKCIITYGDDGIERISISVINKDNIKLNYKGKKYVFNNVEEDTPTDKIEGLIKPDEIGYYTCNECHTLMYEDRTDFYVSSEIYDDYIGAYKTKDKLDIKDRASDDKGEKIPLADDVKYYYLKMNTEYTSMDLFGHKCSYKELSYEDAKNMYKDNPLYAYIWLNEDKEAQIVLYVDLEAKEYNIDDITDEEYRKFNDENNVKDETDYKNIHEIASGGTNVK